MQFRGSQSRTRAAGAPCIPGSPTLEHLRSPAAWRSAELASESDLFFAHFEHRVRLPSPAGWRSPDHPDSEDLGSWSAGVLPEPKYQAFRHDLLIASFHPGHRAKWTAHELCHALVGFAYRPGAPLLFHALGAWLAELLPVTLWYFFDEVRLRRCARHADGGARFQEHCEACERAAMAGPRAKTRADEALQREGLAFLDRELAALARSRRLGRPLGTRYATIDLASDGLTYATAHAERLRAPEMERLVGQFFGAEQGHHASLDALEARVRTVAQGLTERRRVPPWRATRWDYAAQDVGYRLLGVRTQVEGELSRELDRLIDQLAAQRTRQGLKRTIATYAGLVQSVGRARARLGLPSAEDLFAVGYELPDGMGRSVRQLDAGVASACPGAHAALGKDREQVVSAFCVADTAERVPLGRRFSRFLTKQKPGPVSDLARVEAALTHVAPRDPVAHALPWQERADDRVRLSSSAELLRVTHDVLGATPRRAARARPLLQPLYLGVVRTGAQDVDVIELPEALAEALEKADGNALNREALPVDDDGFAALLESGLLVPERYRS